MWQRGAVAIAAGKALVIPVRYCGPPDSGNGGYTSGLVAGALRAAGVACPDGVEVTLRRPPPLDKPLAVTTQAAHAAVSDGDTLVAEARPADAISAVVPAVGYADAVAAAREYPGLSGHPFPTCFTCGPQRDAGDGLRIFPGRLDDGRTAAPWRVPDDIDEATVWAALDCPGGWTVQLEERPRVLGRIAAHVVDVPAAGDDCVVTGQVLREQGRKAVVATALYAPSGALLARAVATWIAVPADFGQQVS